MLRHYITSKYISGTKKSDIELNVNQLQDNGLYEIADPIDFLANDIFICLENNLNPRYGVDDIYEMLQKSGKYMLETYSWDGTDTNSILLVVDTENQKYYYDMKCGYTSRQIYTVTDIEEENVGYLVSEHLINPIECCKLIERCYEPYFKSLKDAQRYQEAKMRRYTHAKGTENSGFRISVIDTVEIVKSDWYNMNLQAAANIREYQLDAEDYRYIENIEDVLAAIKADAYDDLSLEEQANINAEIYHSLYDYIPLDYRIFLDDDLEVAADDEYEEIADTAIKLALINADSEETFNKIHEILGPNEYRVGAITDDIYNDNRGQGFIIMCSDGDMGWYPECYFINEWEGAKGNPFYGKFMKNTNDTLLCLKEYHPELITTRLPRKSDMIEFENKYLEECSKSKRLHEEMVFDLDDNFEPIVIGTWYPEGLKSKTQYENIQFHRDYCSHTFTEDECKALLNGEELIIKNFKTKSDSIITIRGMLKDCTDVFADEMDVKFIRTDIDGNRRRSLNSEFGITEPNLPIFDESGGMF